MSSKATLESKIVHFFQHAPFDSVMSVFGIVKGIMKGRVEESKPLPPTPVKKRISRKTHKVDAPVESASKDSTVGT